MEDRAITENGEIEDELELELSGSTCHDKFFGNHTEAQFI